MESNSSQMCADLPINVFVLQLFCEIARLGVESGRPSIYLNELREAKHLSIEK